MWCNERFLALRVHTRRFTTACHCSAWKRNVVALKWLLMLSNERQYDSKSFWQPKLLEKSFLGRTGGDPLAHPLENTPLFLCFLALHPSFSKNPKISNSRVWTREGHPHTTCTSLLEPQGHVFVTFHRGGFCAFLGCNVTTDFPS